MNKFAKAAMLAAGVALVTQAACASSSDLVLGFTGVGTSADAVIDLGSAAQVGIGGSSVVDLIDNQAANSATGIAGATFTGLLNSVFTTSAGVNAGSMSLVGGLGGTAPFYYATQNRGMAGSPASPVSSAPFAWTKNQQSTVSGQASGVLNGNSINGQGLYAESPLSIGSPSAVNTASFSYQILGINNPGSTIASFGIDPRSSISGNLSYADVWYDKNGQVGQTATSTGWVYEGFLTLDLTGDTQMLLTFTPVPVPEPVTVSLLGGLALLVLVNRYRVARKSA
jgi:hypothetical protein